LGGAGTLELRSYLLELKNQILGLSLGKKVVGSVLLIGVILTFGLAGTVPAQNLQVINGQQYLSKMYAESTNATIGYHNTQSTVWNLSGGSSPASAQVTSPAIVNFSGFFQPSTTSSSAQITRQLTVNVKEYPIVYMQIQMTKGVGYGIRFFSSSNGNLVPLWNNSDILDHRIGTGVPENIQVNMEDLALQNIGRTVQYISQVQIYVERHPTNATTGFSLILDNMEFLNYGITSYQNGTSYHSVYITFNRLPTAGNSSWTLNKIDLGLHISAAPGTTYEIFQLNGTSTYPGTFYRYSPTIASYDYSLYPKGSPIVFPDSLPPTRGYSIVIVAFAGSLNNVTVQSVNFVFTPSQNASTAITPSTVASQGSFWYGYLIFFLFVAPLLTAFYLYNRFRKDEDDFKFWQVSAAVVVGVVCRLALAPVASQPFDISVYATSARGWFDFGSAGTSLGPTLPFTFFLYWVPYSFYALLLKLGLQDFFILGHQTGFFETIFLKTFPITADLFVTYLIIKFFPGKVGKLFAFFYLLNPLSIYVSSVWGQYEASTISFIVLGFVFLSRKGEDEEGGIFQDLIAALAFAVSTMIELVGLIPLAFLLLKSLFARPLKIWTILALLSPLLVLVVYPPEAHLIYLIAAGAVGASSVLLLGQPHTPYALLSNFPGVAAVHPLIFILLGLAVLFVWRKNFDLQSVLTYTMVAFVCFMLFSATQPQWWLFILPLGFMYALVSEKYSVGIYMLAFGTMVAFLTLSFTQGSGYMLFGSAKYNVLPSLEDLRNGIDLFTITTTIGALLLIGYTVAADRIAGTRPLLRSSILLSSVLFLSFLLFSVAHV
jgi:hypothetical protein